MKQHQRYPVFSRTENPLKLILRTLGTRNAGTASASSGLTPPRPARRGKRRIAALLAAALILTTFLPGSAFAAEAAGSEEDGFTFFYMGDSQADPDEGSYEEWGKLYQKAAADGSPAFALLGGDLINDGTDREEWAAFFKAAGDALPLYPAMGNHDNGATFKEMFTLPENGPQGYQEAFYSFDHGNAHFTVLDSNSMGNSDNAEALAGWLQKDLEGAKDKTFKFVMLHHPMYPVLDNPKDAARAEIMRKYYLPVMEEYGVDLILCGHQHSYVRTYPMKDGEGKTSAGEGIVQLMGVSGAKHYKPKDLDFISAKAKDVSVYTRIDLKGNTAVLTTKDAQGNVLDTYEWTKGPATGGTSQADPGETAGGGASTGAQVPESGTSTPSAASKFRDMDGHWAFEEVEGVVKRGLFQGTSDTTFSPDAGMTRAMFVTVLWRMAGKPAGSGAAFTDVAAGSWYADAVAWAAGMGLVSGVGDGKFAPDASVTREQMASILEKFAPFLGAAEGSEGVKRPSYTDEARISQWAKAGVDYCAVKGYITGYSDGSFRPQKPATRAEVATILTRIAV